MSELLRFATAGSVDMAEISRALASTRSPPHASDARANAGQDDSASAPGML